MNAGEVIAKARPRVEEGGIEQQAAQQQQDRLLGPAHDQLIHHVAGLMIAAQGVILSESLQACHIPVRVSEFCSVRGYTVLRILKAFEEKKSDDVFRYFATGWNRDGLVMREMNELLRSHSGSADRHLLILLTDAEPNDSFRIQSSEQFPFGKDYGDEAAVNDTAAEVRALQRKGICVSAVFMGTDAGALKAEIIYGKEYTRIQEVGQLARAAGLLIQKEISKIDL